MPHESAPRVLVADDQADVVTALRLLLKEGRFEADTAGSIPEIRAKLEAGAYDLLLMDLNYARDTTSGREGLDLLAQVHERDPLLPVVVMTGWASIETAVEAMRRGARTFVHKPWENAALFDTLRREVAHGRAARLAQRSASREQEEAQAIQRALLPALPPAIPGCELAARWRPATAFGGDFYDAVHLDGRGLMVTIGDVCGKGLPAALLMANVQASMRAFAIADASPRSVAARINRDLAAHAALRRFVTLFYGVYEVETRRFVFTNAGHNPPIVARADGSVERLTGGGMVLGAFDTACYDEHVIVLDPGDRLILFTDGMIERNGADGDEFGDERLVEAVRRRRVDSAAGLADGLFEEITDLAGGRLDDDATVMVMAIR